MTKSQRALVMEFFEANPKQAFEHGTVVDWVTAQWLESHEEPPRDPWRIIRKLHQQGLLKRLAKAYSCMIRSS
jgi:hypothetical protein